MSVNLDAVGINRNENILRLANVNPVYATESEKISAVVDKMLGKKHRRIPVVSNREEVVGIVTSMDILDSFLRKVNFNDKISEIMVRDVISANSDDTINSVLQRMKISRRGGLPVLNFKRLVAMISERDFVKNFSQTEFNKTVSEIMTKKPFFIKEKMSILDCLKSMVNVHYRRLPVVENKKLVGIVTSADMLSFVAGNNFSNTGLDKEATTIATRKPVKVEKHVDVSEAVKIMVSRDVGGLVVVDDNDNLEGVITERDVLEEIV